MEITIDLEKVGLFREATSNDIYEGNLVFLLGDGNELHKRYISEVYNKTDNWKAFCANDGCRYGLDRLYVLKTNAELEKRIDKLENVIKKISSSLNAL